MQRGSLRERHRCGADTGVRRHGRRVFAHRGRRERRGGGPPTRTAGQLRGRPPHDRRRKAHPPATVAHQPGDRGWIVLRECRHCAPSSIARATVALRCTVSASSRREESTATRITRSRSPSLRDAAGSTQSGFTRFSTAAMSHRRARPASSAPSPTHWHGVGVGAIASVAGRYFAMDRDRRWDRVQRAYEVIAGAGNGTATDAVAYIEAQYAADITDEFVPPASILHDGKRIRIEDGDSIIFFNFRPDRARELSHALVDSDFDGFPRSRVLSDVDLVTFTEYERDLDAHVAFPREDVAHTLAEEVSAAGLRQFHVAETEKYAHVTYFINGGREAAFEGEERLLVPSPRVATYDTAPEMSAAGVTDAVVAHLEAGGDALIIANYANADMVGHTGDFDATVRGSGVHRHVPRSCPARGGGRRRWPPDHCRPRQRGVQDRSTRRIGAHCAHDEPGAGDRAGRWATVRCVEVGDCATSRRQCSTRWDSRGACGDDGPVAAERLSFARPTSRVVAGTEPARSGRRGVVRSATRPQGRG